MTITEEAVLALGEWYRTYFDDYYLAVRRPVEAEERSSAEATFIMRALALPRPARLLDVGCGYGRHAVYLAKWGYRVVGVDINERMIRMAVERARRFKVVAGFRVMDMRAMTWFEEFDGVYCINSFGYFSDEENHMTLACMARALRPGGRLLVDAYNRDLYVVKYAVNGRTPRAHWFTSGGYLVLCIEWFDVTTSRVVERRVYLRNGDKSAERVSSVRAYSLAELSYMLRQVGLRVVKAYGDYDTSAQYTPTSPRLIVVAEKPAEAG